MGCMSKGPTVGSLEESTDDLSKRREFLKACGKYAAVVPPAMVLLMTRSTSAHAFGLSGGGKKLD